MSQGMKELAFFLGNFDILKAVFPTMTHNNCHDITTNIDNSPPVKYTNDLIDLKKYVSDEDFASAKPFSDCNEWEQVKAARLEQVAKNTAQQYRVLMARLTEIFNPSSQQQDLDTNNHQPNVKAETLFNDIERISDRILVAIDKLTDTQIDELLDAEAKSIATLYSKMAKEQQDKLKKIIVDCLEYLRRQKNIEEIKQSITALPKPEGTVIYFPPQLLSATKVDLSEHKSAEFPRGITYEYPQRVSLDIMIADIVDDIEKKINSHAITYPIKISGMSIGGMVGSEVAKKLCERGIKIEQLAVHNTSRSLSKLVSSLTLFPAVVMQVLIIIGLGQDLDTQKNIDYLARQGISTAITATKGDWLMQGGASFIPTEHNSHYEDNNSFSNRLKNVGRLGSNILVKIPRNIHLVNSVQYEKYNSLNKTLKNVGRFGLDVLTGLLLLTANVVAIPIILFIAVDRLSTRSLKNKYNQYTFGERAFGAKILEYNDNTFLNGLRFMARFTIKAVAFVLVPTVVYPLKSFFAATIGQHKSVNTINHNAANSVDAETTLLPDKNHVDAAPPSATISIYQYQPYCKYNSSTPAQDLHSQFVSVLDKQGSGWHKVCIGTNTFNNKKNNDNDRSCTPGA